MTSIRLPALLTIAYLNGICIFMAVDSRPARAVEPAQAVVVAAAEPGARAWCLAPGAGQVH